MLPYVVLILEDDAETSVRSHETSSLVRGASSALEAGVCLQVKVEGGRVHDTLVDDKTCTLDSYPTLAYQA